MPFSKIEGLTDAQKTEIAKHHDDAISVLTKERDTLLSQFNAIKVSSKLQGEEIQRNKDGVDRDKIKNATSLVEMKQLLAERDKKTQDLEQRILNDEKTRFEAEQSQIVSSFVDKFVNEQVVPDSLVRDAITAKISKRLSVRNNNIVEISGSELTGKTGRQVLDEIRLDKGYSNYLVANSASGGGAGGGAGGGGKVASKSITRNEYKNMGPLDAAKYFKDGGVIDSNGV